MKRYSILIIVFLIFLNSCKEKPPTITKFIYIRVPGVVYDSLERPYLWILPYFEYQKDKQFKIATGKEFRRDSAAPPNGLNCYFELDKDKETIELINKTLLNKNFDSTYNAHIEPRCNYFLYETSDNKKRVITFGAGNFPDGFKALLHHLNSLIYPENRLISIKPFVIDSMVVNMEKKVFSKYPPPPYRFSKKQTTDKRQK
ncbi:MAG: hypothetical protein HXX16_09930 [Bacteroidales bacterium]|nr:hypothetical protein [Bacteroidales bacterium]